MYIVAFLTANKTALVDIPDTFNLDNLRQTETIPT